MIRNSTYFIDMPDKCINRKDRSNKIFKNYCKIQTDQSAIPFSAKLDFLLLPMSLHSFGSQDLYSYTYLCNCLINSSAITLVVLKICYLIIGQSMQFLKFIRVFQIQSAKISNKNIESAVLVHIGHTIKFNYLTKISTSI